MAEYDVSRVAAIILRRFHGYGSKGEHTMPFDELADSIRADLIEYLKCGPYELPVIAHYKSRSEWIVLTTCQLVVSKASSRVSIPWLEFADFIVDLDEDTLGHFPSPKERMNTLTLLTTSGKSISIATDPGPSFLGFWNSLIMAKRMAPEEARRKALFETA